MVCPKCGAEIMPGTLFCVSCGSPAPVDNQAAQPQQFNQPMQQFNQPQAPQQPGQFNQPQMPQQPGQFNQPQAAQQPGQFSQPQAPQQPGQFNQPQAPQQPGQPGQFAAPPQPGMPGAPGMPGMPAMGGGINGFLGKLKAEPLRWTEVVGIVFIFFSAIIPVWITVKSSLVSYRESIGLFGSRGIWPIVGLLYILLSVFIALMKLDCIPQLTPFFGKYQTIPFSQFYYAGFVFLSWFLYFLTSVGSIEHSTYYSVVYGCSFWLCFLGIILVAIVPVMKFIKKENYYA